MLYTTLFFGYVAARNYVVEKPGASCSDGNFIYALSAEDEEQYESPCQLAAEAFGFEKKFRKRSINNFPKGCIVYQDKRGRYHPYYNTPSDGGEGAQHEKVRSICDAAKGQCEDKCAPWSDSNMCGYLPGSSSPCPAEANAAPANTGSRGGRSQRDVDDNEEPTTFSSPSSSYRRPAATSSRRGRHSLSRSSQKIAHSAKRLAQADSKTIIIVVVGTTLVIGLAVGIPIAWGLLKK